MICGAMKQGIRGNLMIYLLPSACKRSPRDADSAKYYLSPAACINACVLGSNSPSPLSICLAITLPSSTPN